VYLVVYSILSLTHLLQAVYNKNRAIARNPRDATVNVYRQGECRQLFSFDTRGHANVLKC